MRPFVILLIIILFIVVMDLYASRGLTDLFSMDGGSKKAFLWVFWGISAAMFAALIWAGYGFRNLRDPSTFFGLSLVMGIFLMLYVPKLLFNVFQLPGDLTAGITRLFNPDVSAVAIRKYFLVPGIILGLSLLVAFGMGMARGRTNVKVFRETVPLATLPESFDSLRVVQISDFHLAGFYNHPRYVVRIVDLVNRLEPDLVLFTGDMVHNFANELVPFVPVLQKIKAPLGKFAILGNHDYGHYFNWEERSDEVANFEKVKEQIRESGFDLLLNEHRKISLNGDTIELVGVENWGKSFQQMGDLDKALRGTDQGRFKILMSHDPSHWNQKIRTETEIPLTLSGHTHGAQFGFELGEFKWSPSKWIYRYWAGLYEENGQYLYVNRGLGYTGFPGRVGIRPEITVLTLVKSPGARDVRREIIP